MEKWKDIPGYEGIYQASTDGRIRSTEGKTTSNKRYSERVWKERILKQKYHGRKNTNKMDARICLWKNGSCKTYLVARLIAETWCDGYSAGMTVNHIDGDTLNNKSENLEWVSLADNIRHGFKTGLYKTQKPCTLTSKDGIKTTFRSITEAARSIGRSPSYIRNCFFKNRPIRSVDGDVYGAS